MQKQHHHICDAHDTIDSLADKIRTECNRDEPNLNQIDDWAWEIQRSASTAKEMGERMEEALVERKEQKVQIADELESTIASLIDMVNELTPNNRIHASRDGITIR